MFCVPEWMSYVSYGANSGGNKVLQGRVARPPAANSQKSPRCSCLYIVFFIYIFQNSSVLDKRMCCFFVGLLRSR